MGAPSSARLTNSEAIEIMKRVSMKHPTCVKYVFSQGEWPDGTPADEDDEFDPSRVPWLDADKKAPDRPPTETFADIIAADPSIHVMLDEDVFSVFDAMVTADVLI